MTDRRRLRPILKGERASDLPVQRPSKFELAVNVRTVKALRLDLPPALLVQADVE